MTHQRSAPPGVKYGTVVFGMDGTELDALLRQLHWHHASQAKPGAAPCTKQYHRELVERLAKLTGLPVPK